MSDSTAQLHTQAIQAALSSNWEEALRLNELILETEPNNTDALNRLARSHFELGDLSKSKKFYEQALKIDPYNQIASKFLVRIDAYQKKGVKHEAGAHQHVSIDPSSFIEEPGKTKLVNLIKVAEPQRLFLLSSGEMVKIVAKNRSISVVDQSDRYLGALPDDVAHRLLRFIKGGNKYQAYIKTIKANGLSVLVKETYRSAKFKNQPSFNDNLSATLAYSSDHILVTDDDEVDIMEDSEDDSSR